MKDRTLSARPLPQRGVTIGALPMLLAAIVVTVALTTLAVRTLTADAPSTAAATTAATAPIMVGDVTPTMRALGTLLWIADGNTVHCPEDALYWFNGWYSAGLGWERECIPIDDLHGGDGWER